MSFFSKLFNKGDAAATKEQKEIEKKLKDINRLRLSRSELCGNHEPDRF